MSLWSHIVYHFAMILHTNYTSVSHQSDYININPVSYFGETNVKMADPFLRFVTVLHVLVAVQRRLLKGYRLVHLNVDFSAGAEKISVTLRCHQGEDT